VDEQRWGSPARHEWLNLARDDIGACGRKLVFFVYRIKKLMFVISRSSFSYSLFAESSTEIELLKAITQ
jgi:hypothetical protein